MILMAQSVPSARQLPCIRSLPLGWSLSGATIVRGRATFELLVMGGDGVNGSIQLQVGRGGGAPVVDVTLTPTCSSTNSDSTIQTVERPRRVCHVPISLPAGVGPVRVIRIPAAGCRSSRGPSSSTFVDRDEDLVLCGADAPCP